MANTAAGREEFAAFVTVQYLKNLKLSDRYCLNIWVILLFVTVTDYCIGNVKFDMGVNYIHNNTLYGKYCYLKDMTVRLCQCMRLQATNLGLTEQF